MEVFAFISLSFVVFDNKDEIGHNSIHEARCGIVIPFVSV